MKAHVRIREAICKDPDCCGGEDYPNAVTLNPQLAKAWDAMPNYRVIEVDLID